MPYLDVGVGVIFAFRVQLLLLPPLKSYSLGLLFGLLVLIPITQGWAPVDCFGLPEGLNWLSSCQEKDDILVPISQGRAPVNRCSVGRRVSTGVSMPGE